MNFVLKKIRNRKLKIILASASPRRKELLKEAGYHFQIVPSQVDESVFPTEGIGSAEYSKQLALAKADDIAQKYPDCLVIGADTVVDFDGQIIGKPEDAKDAERITRMLFSKPHKVITGVAFICINKNIKIIEADITKVYPKKLTDEQIAQHIKSGIWEGKAGAYSIRDNDPFVERIEGSFTNVMGFPMEMIQRILFHHEEH